MSRTPAIRVRARLLPALLAAASLAAGPALAAPPTPPAQDGGGKSESDPQARRITGSDNYVPTFGLRASITRGFTVHGVLAVDAGLDIPSPASRRKAEAVMPRVTSAMRDAVLNYASLSYTVGERPDADILRARLQRAVDGVLGKGEATVTLASVIIVAR